MLRPITFSNSISVEWLKSSIKNFSTLNDHKTDFDKELPKFLCTESSLVCYTAGFSVVMQAKRCVTTLKTAVWQTGSSLDMSCNESVPVDLNLSKKHLIIRQYGFVWPFPTFLTQHALSILAYFERPRDETDTGPSNHDCQIWLTTRQYKELKIKRASRNTQTPSQFNHLRCCSALHVLCVLHIASEYYIVHSCNIS